MPVPEHLEWDVWEVVSSGLATLREVEEHWSWADLVDARTVLELQRRAERRARLLREAQARAARRR